MFLRCARFLRIYDGLYWHATNELERDQIIESGLADAERVFLARNLKKQKHKDQSFPEIEKEPGTLRLVFLSRITAMKNLNFALDVLSGFTTGKIIFDI